MDEPTSETLFAYLQGDLNATESAALEKQLLLKESLRRELLELASEESALSDWARTERAQIALEDKVFESAAVPAFPRSALWWLSAAAIFIAGCMTFAAFQMFSGRVPEPTVARLMASIDAAWETRPKNYGLPSGQYELRKGSIDLAFADGAHVRIGGPATFSLKGAHHIHLEAGSLVAEIPDEALGFIVTSPQSEVIDLGTEFGLSVSGSGRTDVHVLDGLVEVLPRDLSHSTAPVLVHEGQARRFETRTPPDAIPLISPEELLGQKSFRKPGFQMLRGSVRVTETLSLEDLRKRSVGRNWIDLIPEQRDVQNSEVLAVSINSHGSYRDFEDLENALSAGQNLDSYLLHFRPGNLDQVRGVLRFDQPIVAILCTASHLEESDALFGSSNVEYPPPGNAFRGLEPNGRPTAQNARETDPDWQPDELVLSQDRHTLSIRAFANTERGYDQIRILTKALPRSNSN